MAIDRLVAESGAEAVEAGPLSADLWRRAQTEERVVLDGTLPQMLAGLVRAQMEDERVLRLLRPLKPHSYSAFQDSITANITGTNAPTLFHTCFCFTLSSSSTTTSVNFLLLKSNRVTFGLKREQNHFDPVILILVSPLILAS